MSPSTFAVKFVPSARDIDSALWESCFPPSLEGQWWYLALEDSGLEDQFSFLYGVIRRRDVPVGIAPAFTMNFPVSLVAPRGLLGVVRWIDRLAPSLVRPKTLFVGSPCADEGSVGFVNGVDQRAALLALQEALETHMSTLGADLLVWKDFRESGSQDLEWLAARKGLFRVTSFPGTAVEFAGPHKEDYLSSLKGSRRHNLRKKLRRSLAHADLSVEIIRSPNPRTLDEIFALFWQTYERARTRFERLNRNFFARLAALPHATFIVLKEKTSGAMVAFMLCFDLGSKIINKFIGLDYRRPKEWLLYFRLWDAAVDWALSRGAPAIQSGQTGYAPKIETGHKLVPLFNYCRHRNPVVHAVARISARRIDWASLDDELARHVKAHP